MAEKQIILTQEGLKALEMELEKLKVSRNDVAEKLKEARSHGDLSENSEYDEAKNEQGLVESRIAEIEATLKNVTIIDEKTLNTEFVQHGNKVKVLDMEENEEVELYIVGTKEVSMKDNKISDQSPIGKALLGRSVGDVVEVTVPDGTLKFKVLDISK